MGWLRPYVMLVRLNVTIELSNVSKKKKPLNVTEIRSYVMMEQSKMRKTIRVPPNVTKVRSEVMLILHNKIIELSNVRKKIKEPPKMTKEPPKMTRELLHVMLELHNVRIELSNVRKK